MLTVLLIEDTAVIRMIVRQQLLSIGVTRIHVASDGVEALQILKNQDDIDLIISDWHMSPMDGLTFCGMMKKMPSQRGRYMPVVFISSDPKLADVAKREKVLDASRHLGIIGILPKPFTTEQLREKLSIGVGIHI